MRELFPGALPAVVTVRLLPLTGYLHVPGGYCYDTHTCCTSVCSFSESSCTISYPIPPYLTLPYLTLGTHHVSHPLHTRQRRDVAWLLFHRVVYYCQSVVSDIDTNRFRFGARALPNHIHAASETARYSCRTSHCSCLPTTSSYLTELGFLRCHQTRLPRCSCHRAKVA